MYFQRGEEHFYQNAPLRGELPSDHGFRSGRRKRRLIASSGLFHVGQPFTSWLPARISRIPESCLCHFLLKTRCDADHDGGILHRHFAVIVHVTGQSATADLDGARGAGITTGYRVGSWRGKHNESL